MNKLIITAFVVFFNACSMQSNEKPNALDTKKLSQEEVKAAWEKSMSKAEEHQILQEMAGKWDASVKFWPHPSLSPSISMAKSTNKSILDGKFLVEDYQGSFGGKPFQGMSVMGYDTILRKFSNYWADNMGTGAIFSEGTYDPQTKVISLKGDVTDPISGSKRPTHSTIKLIDNNNHVLEMFDLFPDGKSVKTLEINYKRIP